MRLVLKDTEGIVIEDIKQSGLTYYRHITILTDKGEDRILLESDSKRKLWLYGEGDSEYVKEEMRSK